MKKIIYLFLVFLPLLLKAQVPEIRVEQDLEISSTAGPVVLTATKSITLRPTTWIKPGSDFTMRIVADAYFPLSLSNENYILTRAFQTATQDGVVSSNSDVIESVVYFDGLGRAKQNVGIKQSPSKKDIVTHISYDDLGRQVEDYLPYVSTTNNGSIKLGAELATKEYYQNHYADDFPGITDVNQVNAFSKKTVENSPLSRVLSQAAPGKSWKQGGGHEINLVYESNSVGEVKLFRVSTTSIGKVYEPSLIGGGTVSYKAGELYKVITKDENHDGTVSKLHTTEEFKNKEGQVVLKRTYALVEGRETAHDTYYIYDDFGNLTYVFPPKVNIEDGISNTELLELCYQYKYDYRNRLVEKKIPGKGWEYIVYDKLDRPVMTQDANLRLNKQWLFTKYDVLGRVIYTGIYTHDVLLDQSDMQDELYRINTGFTKQYEVKLTAEGLKGIYYTNANFPSQNTEVLTVNYYDEYMFDMAGAPNSVSIYKSNEITKSNTQGLTTGSKVKVLSTDKWITTVTLHDEKSRAVYVYSNNEYLNTVDIVESKLDFVGKVEETKTTHTKTGKDPIVTIDMFSYDHAARLLSQNQKINSQATETIVTNHYDELGQLESKEVGGGLQKVDFDYNIRGWLTQINEDGYDDNDLFNFEIRYNTPTNGEALFNGNIAQTSWRTLNEDPTKKTYTYSYDALNRLTDATGVTTSNYDVSGITYDKNGNIEFLERRGHVRTDASGNITLYGVMDKLYYDYDSGNKLEKVTDTGNTFGFKDGNTSGDDYTYDANGNMITDANKGITDIYYNHLNLPTGIDFGATDDSTINYIYDATGVKLKKIVVNETANSETETIYAGNYIYENNTLKQFSHLEGYVQKDGNSFNYVYQYRDIWRNIRITYSDLDKNGVITQSTEILREQNYYPYGLEQKGYNSSIKGVKSNFKQYQSQEFTEDLGLNTHEWRYRVSDPSIGRFWQVDPLAEDYDYNSTYAFAENKLGIGIELEGLEITPFSSQINGLSYSESTSVVRDKRTISVIRHETYGKQTVDVSTTKLTLSSKVKQEHVTDYSARVIADNLDKSGNTSTRINSAYREPKDQARAMYGNLVGKGKRGIAAQKRLYSSSGDKVIDTFANAQDYNSKAQEVNELVGFDLLPILDGDQIKSLMTDKINQIGPGKVSKHSSDPKVYNTIDVSHSQTKKKKAFHNSIIKDKRIKRVKDPYNSTDPAFHIEIPQQR